MLDRDPLHDLARHPECLEWVRNRRSREGLLIVDRFAPYPVRRQLRAMCHAAEIESGHIGVTDGWRWASTRSLDPNYHALCISNKYGQIVSMIICNSWGKDIGEWIIFGGYTVPEYRGQWLQSLLVSVAAEILPGVVEIMPVGVMKHYSFYHRLNAA